MKNKKRNLPKMAALLVLLAVLLFSSCKPTEPPEEVIPDYPVKIGTNTVKERPKTVVSLSPAVSQTMFELEIGGRIAGISDNCRQPVLAAPEMVDYLRCGTAQNPNIEVIKQIMPDVIIAPASMSDNALRQLQQLGTEIVVMATPQSLDELEIFYTDLYRIMYGENIGVEKSIAFLSRFTGKLHALYGYAVAYDADNEEPLSAVYIGPDLLHIATGDTLEGELLELLGLSNWGAPYANFSYPQEKEIDLLPDVIFYNGLVNKNYITSSGCYKTTPAVKNDKVLLVPAFSVESRAPRSILKALKKMGETAFPAS